MPQRSRLVHDAVAAELAGAGGHLGAHLDDVVDVALGVGAPRDRQPDEVEVAGRSEPSGCRPNITVPISQARTPPTS